MLIYFERGEIVGAKMAKYLLEKSRIVTQVIKMTRDFAIETYF